MKTSFLETLIVVYMQRIETCMLMCVTNSMVLKYTLKRPINTGQTLYTILKIGLLPAKTV